MKESETGSPEWRNHFLELWRPISTEEADPARAYKTLVDLIALFGLAFTVSNEKLPGRTKEITVALARRGWFLPDNFYAAELVQWLMLLRTGDEVGITKNLVDYIGRRIPDIEHELYQMFPKRKKIFQAAFRAHKRKQYILAVPVFLTQIDGICSDKVGLDFFRKTTKSKMVSIIESLQLDPWEQALLGPLLAALPLSANTNTLKSPDLQYNRHAILHGLATEYGTEEISLKMISLLGFLTKHLPAIAGKQEGGSNSESASS